MIEYRIHGRGGQGSVAAAYLLAATAFEAGQECQAFPSFGAERRGAPVAAFVRTALKPILLRSQVKNPDFLIIQDDTLLHDHSITSGLKSGGAMLVNSTKPSEEIAEEFDCRAFSIDATELAMKIIGKPIPNTALLAAFLGLTGIFPLSALSSALSKRFKGAILEKNLELIELAFESVPLNLWKELENA